MQFARVARLSILALSTSVPLLLSAPSPAFAAEETSITPFLRGRVGIGYRGQFVQGQYVRDKRIVGAREEERQFTDFDLRFGAWKGLETYLRFSHVNWDRVRWQDMTFNNGVPPPGGPEQVERRKGLSDVWLGTKYAILSEARKTGDVSTWTVETSVKLPSSFEVYPSTNGDPEAPAGTPGFEWLLRTSFSKRVRFFDPYVSFFYLHRGTASSPDEDVDAFNLADSWGTFFGTEIVGFERPADDLRFSGDIGIGWRYVMEGQTPANRFLYGPDSGPAFPNPPGNVVTEQGYTRYDVRLGFFYQLQKRVQARGHLMWGLPSEHFIESYPRSYIGQTNEDERGGETIRNKEFTDFQFHFTMIVNI